MNWDDAAQLLGVGTSVSDTELKRAYPKAVKLLKFHPRDALPNATVLARADALYVELVGEPRQLLGQAIAQFRAVLESQQPEAIAEFRAVLQRLVTDLSG